MERNGSTKSLSKSDFFYNFANSWSSVIILFMDFIAIFFINIKINFLKPKNASQRFEFLFKRYEKYYSQHSTKSGLQYDSGKISRELKHTHTHANPLHQNPLRKILPTRKLTKHQAPKMSNTSPGIEIQNHARGTCTRTH